LRFGDARPVQAVTQSQVFEAQEEAGRSIDKELEGEDGKLTINAAIPPAFETVP
jgi:hypothetical protein